MLAVERYGVEDSVVVAANLAFDQTDIFDRHLNGQEIRQLLDQLGIDFWCDGMQFQFVCWIICAPIEADEGQMRLELLILFLGGFFGEEWNQSRAD